jgi:hypothetical protein
MVASGEAPRMPVAITPSFISCNYLGCSLATPGDGPFRCAGLRSRPPRSSWEGSRRSNTARAPQAPAADPSASHCRYASLALQGAHSSHPPLPDPLARSNLSSRSLIPWIFSPSCNQKGRDSFRARRQRRRASRSKATASTSSATYSRPARAYRVPSLLLYRRLRRVQSGAGLQKPRCQ